MFQPEYILRQYESVFVFILSRREQFQRISDESSRHFQYDNSLPMSAFSRLIGDTGSPVYVYYIYKLERRKAAEALGISFPSDIYRARRCIALARREPRRGNMRPDRR